MLLASGASPNEAADRAGVSLATVYNPKSRYQEQKGEVAKVIEEKARPGQPAKITPRVEAHITTLACSKAPEGRSQWTLRLLAEKVVELGYVDELSHEAVRKCLKKVGSSRGRLAVAKETVVHWANRWRIPILYGEYSGAIRAATTSGKCTLMFGSQRRTVSGLVS